MMRFVFISSVFVLAGWFVPGPGTAYADDCRLGCGVGAVGCVADLRESRRACHDECKEMPPGRERGQCRRECAASLRELRKPCRALRRACRDDCRAHPNDCKNDCGATARDCFNTVREARANCRGGCRADAVAAAEACHAGDPADLETCLDAVGTARGECLDACAANPANDPGVCGEVFGACMEECNGPDDAE